MQVSSFILLWFLASPYLANFAAGIDYVEVAPVINYEEGQVIDYPEVEVTDYPEVEVTDYQEVEVTDYQEITKRPCETQSTPTTTTTTTTTEKPTTTSTTTTTTTTPQPTTTTTTTTTPKPTTTTTTTTVKPCEKRAKADIIFLLDASSSIGATNWLHQTKFAADIANAFTIGVHDILFGCLIFNDKPSKIFDLNTYLDKQTLVSTINGIPYPKAQGTYTYRGFRTIREDALFSAAHGGRADAGKIVIVMTDGRSADKTKTIEEAGLLKAQGVTVIAVGIGKDVDSSELQGMATDPKKVFTAEGYELLDIIKKELVNFTCDQANSG